MCSIVVLIPPTLNRKSLQGIHILVNKFSANTTSIYATRVRSYFQKLPILRLPLLLQLGGENMPKLFNLDPEKTINRHLMSGNPQVKYQTAFSTHGENIHPEMLLQLVLTNWKPALHDIFQVSVNPGCKDDLNKNAQKEALKVGNITLPGSQSCILLTRKNGTVYGAVIEFSRGWRRTEQHEPQLQSFVYSPVTSSRTDLQANLL